MKIFKFGGASVKDAAGIKNVYSVLEQVGYSDVLLVVSAMGKTTNALEVVVHDYFNKSASLQSSIQEVKKYHNHNRSGWFVIYGRRAGNVAYF
jgi:aspartate kinase